MMGSRGGEEGMMASLSVSIRADIMQVFPNPISTSSNRQLSSLPNERERETNRPLKYHLDIF